eukprot:669940-Rhodomonas_salina.1
MESERSRKAFAPPPLPKQSVRCAAGGSGSGARSHGLVQSTIVCSTQTVWRRCAAGQDQHDQQTFRQLQLQ